MNDTEVLLTINATIEYRPKINYILSHEISHGLRTGKLFLPLPIISK